MTERKPKKKKKGESEDAFVLSKDELAVAKHLRFNLTTKKSTLYGDAVEYFMGSKAVDLLLDSKWAKSDAYSVVFTDRESVSDFLNKLIKSDKIRHVNLIRTEKKVKEGKDGKDGKKKKKTEEKKSDEKKVVEDDGKSTPKAKKGKSDEKKVVEDDGKSTPKAKKGKDGKEPRKVKKKVKTTLEAHDHQYFFDADVEAYAWFFDPISAKTFALGILLVLAVVGICLFPLWPESVREYSWYISVAGAIFVGCILALAILRYIVYGVLWVCTVGQLDFWMLPNLTAECGFFESFVPAYEYTFKAKPKEDDDEDEDEMNEELLELNEMEITDDPVVTIATEELEEQVTMATDEVAVERAGDVVIDDDNGSEGSREGDWVRLEKDDADNGCHGDSLPGEVTC